MSDSSVDPAEIYLQPSTLLVFPSEVVADGWRRALAADPAIGAVRTDRVLSWDRFKQIIVPVRRAERPADRLFRNACARSLLASNARESWLSEIVSPSWAEYGTSRAAALVTLLPMLPKLMTARPRLRPSLAEDVTQLHERYTEALARFGRYEPEWEEHVAADIPLRGRRPVIFWPDMLEDYDRYAPLLDGLVDIVARPQARRSVSTTGATSTTATIDVYPTIEVEIEAALDRVENALERGVRPGAIAISVAGLEAVQPILAERATRRSIPLRFAAGRALADEPVGRLLSLAAEAVAADFSVHSLDALLSFYLFPNAARADFRHLIRFGYRAHCYRDADWRSAWGLAGRLAESDSSDYLMRDLGLPASFTATRIDGLRQEYYRITEALRNLLGAKTAGDLRAHLMALRRRLADDPSAGSWSASEVAPVERTWQIALDELGAIVALESAGITIDAPWPFLVEALAGRRYVARADGDAVTVHDWRVAAGVPVTLHLALNCSQRATRVGVPRPPFLRREEAEAIDWGVRDRSAAFLEGYATLGAEEAFLSCSLSGPDGAQVVATELPAQVVESPTATGGSRWEAEERWWASADAALPALRYSAQAAGLTAASKTVLSPPVDDLQQGAPGDPTLAAHLAGIDRLSATGLATWLSCPFSWFVKEVVRVRESNLDWEPDTYRLEGSLLHRVMRSVTSTPRADVTPDAIAAMVVAEMARGRNRLLLSPGAQQERARFWGEAIYALTTTEGFWDWENETWEETIEAPIALDDGSTFTLEGRIDRLVRRSDQTILIDDIKRSDRSAPSGGKVAPKDAVSLLDSKAPQLPVYAMIVRRTHAAEVARLAYLVLRDGAVKVVADPQGRKSDRAAAELLDAWDEALPATLSALRSRIASGDFACSDDGECGGCGIRAICRSCFNAARRSDVSA